MRKLKPQHELDPEWQKQQADKERARSTGCLLFVIFLLFALYGTMQAIVKAIVSP